MKLTDVDTHHPLSILNQCSRNIPVPCTDHQLNVLIIIAFRDFLEDVIQATVRVWQTLRCCGQSFLRKETRQLGPQKYTKLRKRCDGVIFSPLDKNSGAVFYIPVPIMKNLSTLSVGDAIGTRHTALKLPAQYQLPGTCS